MVISGGRYHDNDGKRLHRHEPVEKEDRKQKEDG